MNKQIALLHGAGYVGGELIRLLLGHPDASLVTVTSRAFSGEPVWKAHPPLRGQTQLVFADPDEVDVAGLDAVLLAAEHGKGAHAVLDLHRAGFEGTVIDLSADFRFQDAALYDRWFGFTHPAPELIRSFTYGLPEIHAPYSPGTRHIANPGCFATALSLALWPVSRHLETFRAAVTALTGASGSGARPRETTHFPTREGNVRAYKVRGHQHMPEVEQVLGPGASVQFVPASGPWTRGIWGLAQVLLPERVGSQDVQRWFFEAYRDRPFVRLYPDELPELRFAVHSPFCDIGWVVNGRELVIAFAEDNLLKGAASQAVQNLNLLMGWPEAAGLLASEAQVSTALS
jgi:N-acetyl-gamma-glutamyl-phosphate reductase